MESKRILMIDDDRDLREILGALFEIHSYTFFGAGTGQEGLDMIAAVRPDLVILDIVMEDMVSGIKVLMSLRRAKPPSPLHPYSSVPVILLTGTMEELRDDYRRVAGTETLPVQAFFEKPIKGEDLLSRVERILSERNG